MKTIYALLTAFLLSAFIVPVSSAAPVIETSSTSAALWYKESFDKGSVASGSWDRGPYTKSIFVTDKIKENEKAGWPAVFDKRSVSVHDGVLDLFAYRNQNADGSWNPIVSSVVPLLGGNYAGIRHARFEYKLGFFPGPVGMPNWQYATLLWDSGPNGGNWRNGEVDFPENTPGQNEALYVHETGNNPAANCYSLPTGQMTGWHNYAIDWKPGLLSFYRDGVKIGSTKCGLPLEKVVLKFQIVTLGKNISPDSFGHVFVDDIKIYKYS